jgi:peptide/nickel transport system substrate-binding protein
MARVAVAVLLVAGIARIGLLVHDQSVVIPVAGGNFTEGLLGQPAVINPLVATAQVDQDIAALIFSPLSTLADHVVSDEIGLTYTLTLKEDLVWDDGKPLTSDDIVFSVRTIQDPKAASPLSQSWKSVKIERVSALTVRFTLTEPFGFFGDIIASLRVIPHHIYGAVPPENFSLSAYRLRPVGSGPFKFHDFQTRRDGFITEYILVANERYVGKPPFLERFAFLFYTNERELADALRLREIQGTGSLAPLPASLSEIPGIRVMEFPMPRYYAVFMNQLNAPALKNAKLRQAMSLAINRDLLVREVFFGHGIPLASPASPYLFANTSTSLPLPHYDPEEAARLIENVSSGTARLTLTVPRVPFLMSTARILAESWRAVGIEVTVLPRSPEELATVTIPSRNFELLLFGNILSNPLDMFPFWHSSQRFASGLNLSLFQSRQVDELLEQTRRAAPGAMSPEEVVRAATLIADGIPAAFLVSVPYLYIVSDRLSGLSPRTIIAPSDRFSEVELWSVARARIIE